MRKIPSPDENRKRAERLFDGQDVTSGNDSPLKNGKSKPKRAYESEEAADVYGEGGTHTAEELIKKSAKKSAREYAMLLVSSHTYTEKGLWLKIKSKGVYSEEDITDALGYVKSFGYVNDRRLAEDTVQKLAERCFGRSKICRYLASKGISEDIIEGLDFSEVDFVYYCKKLMDKYSGKPNEKVMRALLNAGYTYGEIAEAKSRR